MLRAIEIKQEGIGQRTWRRLFVDVYKLWQIDPAVHGLITGHSAIASANTVSVRRRRTDTLTQVCFDPRAAHLLAAAREVMEHCGRCTSPRT